jgi:hypothetical protein
MNIEKKGIKDNKFLVSMINEKSDLVKGIFMFTISNICMYIYECIFIHTYIHIYICKFLMFMINGKADLMKGTNIFIHVYICIYTYI